jgi:hypothetical protein
VAAEAEKLNAKLAELDDILKSAARFLPPDLRAAVFAAPKNPIVERFGGARPQCKWGPVVFEILSGRGAGMTTTELRAALQLTPLADDLVSAPNGLYNALTKLVKKGELLRIGQYYCLPGQEPGGLAQSKTARLTAFVWDLLEQHPRGITSREIADTMRGTEHEDYLKSSPSIIYNVLSKFTVQGKATKEGRIYSIADRDRSVADEPSLFRPRVVRG